MFSAAARESSCQVYQFSDTEFGGGDDPLLNGNTDVLAFPIGAAGPRQGVILAIVDTAFIDDGAATNKADK